MLARYLAAGAYVTIAGQTESVWIVTLEAEHVRVYTNKTGWHTFELDQYVPAS